MIADQVQHRRQLLKEFEIWKTNRSPSASTNPFKNVLNYLWGTQSQQEKQKEDVAQRPDRWAQKFYPTLGEALRNVGEARQIVPNWLPAGGVTFVLAKFSTGKTLLLIDLALCLATDRDWMGYRTARQHYSVYLVGEDEAGTLKHAEAWYKHYGIDPDDTKPRIIFAPMTPDLLDDSDCELLVQHLKRQLPEDASAVVFIDTWQRASAAGAQNDDKPMQDAIKNAELIGKKLNGPVVTAAHPPKGNDITINGSGVLENISAAIWRMEKKKRSELRTVTVTRIKGAAEGSELKVRIEPQALDGEDDGVPRAGVLLLKDGASREQLPKAASEAQAIADGLDDHERALLVMLADRPGLSFEKLAIALDWKGPEGKPIASRAKNKLKGLKLKGLVTNPDGGSYFLTEKGKLVAQVLGEAQTNVDRPGQADASMQANTTVE